MIGTIFDATIEASASVFDVYFRMSLTLMPVEILERIYQYIPKWSDWRCKEDVRTLHGLCVSSRYLYRVFKPHLYECIVIDATDLFLLMRSIVHNPDLALLTRTLRISRPPVFDLGKAYTLLRADRRIPSACIRHLHPGDQATLSILFLEVLILSLRNVQDLFVSLNWIPHSVQLFHTRRWKTTPTNILPNLNEIKVLLIHDSEGFGSPYALMQVQHILPTAKRIHAEFDETNLSMETCSFYLPALEELDLKSGGMELEDLRKLVESCPNVRRFHFQGGFTPYMQPEPMSEWVAVGSVITIIQPWERQLSHLSIHFHHPNEYDDYGEHLLPEDRLTDLRRFTKLRHLSLDHLCLWEPVEDTDNVMSCDFEFLCKLPRSLETFRIFLADSRVIEELKTLPAWKLTTLPHLMKLELEHYDGYTGGPDPLPKPLVDLMTQLQSAGTAIVMT